MHSSPPPKPNSKPPSVPKLLHTYWPHLLLAGMLTLLASAFILTEFFGVLPCPMCWWQRYIHMALAAAACISLSPRTHAITVPTIGILALAGLGIASWQFAAQNGLLPWPPSCGSTGAQALATQADDLLAAMQSTKVVPCDKENFKLLGLSLAAYNIPIMASTAALAAYIFKTKK